MDKQREEEFKENFEKFQEYMHDESVVVFSFISNDEGVGFLARGDDKDIQDAILATITKMPQIYELLREVLTIHEVSVMDQN